MTQQAYKPFKGRTIRITVMDACCTPPASGTQAAIGVFDSYLTVSLEPNIEEGERAFERKANGDVCLNEKEDDLLQDIAVTVTLCQVLPEVVSAMTGWPVTRDPSSQKAIGFDFLEGASDGSTAFESWTGVSGIDCGEGAKYGYNVFPCVNGWMISEAIEWGGADTIAQIVLKGTASSKHVWGNGPYNVQNGVGAVPGPLVDELASGAFGRTMVVDIAPPSVTDGMVPATAGNGYLHPPA